MELDENYQYVLVGAPTRKYLWILSRTSTLNDETYNMLVSKAKENGFNTDILIKTEQDCEQ
jgi:apolipoprotein D and lipocalin family protein